MKNFSSFLSKNASFWISTNELKKSFIFFFILSNFVHGQNIYLNNFDSKVNSNSIDYKTNNLVNTEDELNYIWLNLIGQNEQFCQMALGYRANATNCVDDYYSTRIDGQFTLNSLICNDTNDYVIQSRAMPFNPDDSVLLSIKIPAEGNYTIFLDHTIGLFNNPSQPIYIHDFFTNTYYNLRLGAYNFHSNNGIFYNRFQLNYNPVLSIPTNNNDYNLIVYKDLEDIIINASNQIINNVKIYDISGRLLTEKNSINSNEIKVFIGGSNQVVLVKTTLAEGQIISKKVIN